MKICSSLMLLLNLYYLLYSIKHNKRCFKWRQLRFERGEDYQKITQLYPQFSNLIVSSGSSCLAQWTLNASVLLEWVCETAGVGLNFQCRVFLPKAHRQCPVTLSPLTLNYLYACYCLHVPLHTEAVERNTFNGGVGKRIPSPCPPPVPLHNRTSIFSSAHLALSLFGFSFDYHSLFPSYSTLPLFSRVKQKQGQFPV